MRRIIFVLVLLGLLTSAGAAAEPALLPDHFGPWLAEGPAGIRSGLDLSKGGGDVEPGTLPEAGFRSDETRSYRNGSEELKLSLYRFKDPSGAYEFYTNIIIPHMKSAGLGDESAYDAYQGVILVGNIVL